MPKYWLALGFLAFLIGSAISEGLQAESSQMDEITLPSEQHSKAEYIIEHTESVESGDKTAAPEVVTLGHENADNSAESPDGASDTQPPDRTVDWSTGSSWNVFIILGIFILTNTIKLVPVGIAEVFKYKEAKANAAAAELNHVDSIESVLGPNLDLNISSVRLPSVDTSMTDLSSIDKESIKS